MTEQQNTEPAENADTAVEGTDWKAQARKWEERSKANHARIQELEPLAAKAQELEDASKSELQRLTEQVEAATKRADALEAEKGRLAAIAKHGIPEDHQDLVQGADAEALDRSAEKVRALLDSKNDQGSAYVVPVEGGAPATPLNGDGIENALMNALGIQK